MAAAAPAAKPDYALFIDQYLAKNLPNKKMPLEKVSQIFQNAITALRLKLGVFSDDWKKTEGPANAYILEKTAEYTGKTTKELMQEGMERATKFFSDLTTANSAVAAGVNRANTALASLLDDSKAQQMIISCANCKAVMKEFQRCAACKQVNYCSIECQKKHWKLVHKQECNKSK